MTIVWPHPSARAMASMVTIAMLDAMPARPLAVPLDLAPATPGAALALTDQQRIAAAMAEVMGRRVDQLERGHTLAKDLAQDERFTLRRAQSYIAQASDHVAFASGSREGAIRHAATAAALLLAFIEVQHERAAQEQSEQEQTAWA